MQIMYLEERIKSLTRLGEVLTSELNTTSGGSYTRLNHVIENQSILNSWFTNENVRTAIQAIASELTEENLIKWTSNYPKLKENREPIIAGVIMAGNIPLAGFHDYLSVLISGNKIISKTSSKDSELLIYISEVLFSISAEFKNYIEFTENTLKNFDVIIATGSNNSSRYFEQYFGKYPNIIRKNRNSVAILEGNETDKEFEDLGKDIFTYFGLGCRNVSKIYIPKGFDVEILTDKWKHYSGIINHVKYGNNYDFNKAIYLVNKERFHDTGYLLLKEEYKITSPVSVLNYEYFESQYAAIQQIELQNNNIQCLVGRNAIPFGQAQSPHLWDYADGVDTIEFLLKNNLAGIL
jgi:hypothetical protein